jgi:hypothetical protein
MRIWNSAQNISTSILLLRVLKMKFFGVIYIIIISEYTVQRLNELKRRCVRTTESFGLLDLK